MNLNSVSDFSAEASTESDANTRNNREDERRQVQCASDGDSAAFAELYDRHVIRVYRHIYYVVNDITATEDLTAQTFLKAWEAISRYQDRGTPFAAWLLRIAHNLAISYVRSKREHSELTDTHIDQNREGNPEQTLEHAENQKDVREAILKLGAEQQQVIILRFVEELDYPQVAEILGKSVPTVRVIQHRALGSLRKLMQASA